MRKSSYLLLASSILLALLTGCFSSSSTEDAPLAQAVVSGQVTDAAATALAGVTISVGTASATTGVDGKFSLTVAPGANLKVKAAKAGCVDTFHVISISSSQSLKVDFSLRAVGISNNLASMLTLPTTVNDLAKGTVVTFPAGSVVDANGVAVDSATVNVTTSLATDSGYSENFPGLFVGTKTGADSPLESFGIVTVDITSGGSKCNLGPNKKADIAIPVAAGADPGTATIDLWSLNETTGKWDFEGIATRDASGVPVVYKAQVSHFSTYNLDHAIASGTSLKVTVKNSSGSPVSGVSLLVISNGGTGGVWEGRGTTGADGTYTYASLPSGNISATARIGSLIGKGGSYTSTGNEATMDITLYTVVEKVVTVVYDDAGTEKPAANAALNLWIMSGAIGQGETSAKLIADSSGKVTLELADNSAARYSYSASLTVASNTYTLNGSAATIADIPAKMVLLKP